LSCIEKVFVACVHDTLSDWISTKQEVDVVRAGPGQNSIRSESMKLEPKYGSPESTGSRCNKVRKMVFRYRIVDCDRSNKLEKHSGTSRLSIESCRYE
jgi:hypothetical protein